MVNRSPENEKELDVKLEWVPVQVPDGKAYFYPDEHRRWRKDWSKPAVYRWVLSGQGCKPQFLVGESGDLYKRLQAYVGSTAKRHVNIRRDFDRVSSTGGTVGLEILKIDSFAINGAVIAEDKLGNFFVRRVLENLLLSPRTSGSALDPYPRREGDAQNRASSGSYH